MGKVKRFFSALFGAAVISGATSQVFELQKTHELDFSNTTAIIQSENESMSQQIKQLLETLQKLAYEVAKHNPRSGRKINDIAESLRKEVQESQNKFADFMLRRSNASKMTSKQKFGLSDYVPLKTQPVEYAKGCVSSIDHILHSTFINTYPASVELLSRTLDEQKANLKRS